LLRATGAIGLLVRETLFVLSRTAMREVNGVVNAAREYALSPASYARAVGPGVGEHMNRATKIVGAALVATGLFGGCAPLTFYNALAPADPGVTRVKSDVAYGASPRQKLDIYAPTKRAGTLPVVVFLYGGSWNSGSKADYSFLAKAIAARRFIAVVADYRLVPDVAFPAFLDDSARAVAWSHTHAASFGGDPDRLFVLGHSAGAYNAAMIALDDRYLRAQGFSPAGLRGVAALAGPFDFLPLDGPTTIAAFGGARDLAVTQPINFVTGAAPDMFLATGDDDTTVRPRNTHTLARKLQQVGRPVTVRTYPGIGHVGILLALSRPLRGQAPVLDDVIAYFKARL
jgi:acetyl esterase/lipase